MRRPDARFDVAFTSDYRPFRTLVSDASRALADEPGVSFAFVGWYPDDLELARLPSF